MMRKKRLLSHSLARSIAQLTVSTCGRLRFFHPDWERGHMPSGTGGQPAGRMWADGDISRRLSEVLQRQAAHLERL